MLSNKQLEILKLYSEGFSQKQVAAHLAIKQYTVDYHSRQILQKLKARNMTHAASMAIRRGLI